MPTPEVLPPNLAADTRAHLRGANPAVLAASLAARTGDTARAQTFLAELAYGFERGGVVCALSAARMEQLIDWYDDVNRDDTISDTSMPMSDADFSALASGLVGWEVPAETAAFYREQAGFVDFVATSQQADIDANAFDIVAIGAGMAGIATAVAASKAGMNCRILEKAAQPGGVWQQNTYPGVGVDTPSAYYSFSFEVNQNWSGVYPTGQEYLDYLNHVVDRYDVRKNITFEARVSRLEWDETETRWKITYLKDGREHLTSACAVVTAAGYLTRPQFPQVCGLEDFAGEWFHSSQWNHDYDFADKRVAVVGTGCTSVQVVDALADKVASLTLVQRQPHWVLPPTVDETFSGTERWLNAHVPGYAQWSRLLTFIPISDFNYPVVRYDEEWARTHDLSISQANDQVLQVALGYLQTSFADRPDLMKVLTPNFAPFGKRPIRDPGNYYGALKRETSTVASGLSEVVPEGIIDADGQMHEVDVIVYATGFELDYLANVEVIGRDARRLGDRWGESPVAYNACQVPGFPNLFITSGPHASPSHGGGHNFAVEAVVHYVIESLRDLAARGASSVEPTEEAIVRWKDEVDELMADSVWARETRATTYYRNAKGEVVLASPLTMVDFWTKLRGPEPADLRYGS